MHANDILSVSFAGRLPVKVETTRLASEYLGVPIRFQDGRYVYELGGFVCECLTLVQAMTAIEGTLENTGVKHGQG